MYNFELYSNVIWAAESIVQVIIRLTGVIMELRKWDSGVRDLKNAQGTTVRKM